MFKVILMVSMVFFSTIVSAEKIDPKLLIGKWLAVEADQVDMRTDNEIWEFSRNELRLNLNNDAQSPVLYQLSGDLIYIDSFVIKVFSLSESEMTLEDNGVVYRLQRQSN